MRSAIRRVLALLLLSAVVAAGSNAVRKEGRLSWTFDTKLAPPAEAEERRRIEASLEEVRAASEAGTARIIDARTREAFAAGHIPRATNLPAALLPIAPPFILMRAQPAEEVILYCTGGDCDESNRVYEQLKALGFQTVRIFHGGWIVWEKAGHPVERGPDPLPLGK